MSFVHLHVHSEFSLLDGAARVEKIVEKVSQDGQSAVAITDHGWIAGAIKLVKAAKEAGIKPIVGSELYIATGSMDDPAKDSGDNFHLTVLAQSEEGYRNLMRLTSEGYLRGMSYRPRVDLETLGKYSEGLIVLSGCVGAQIPQLIAHGEEEEAEKLAMWYRDTFAGRFFLEVQNHGHTGGIDHVRINDDAGGVLMYEHELNDALFSMADRLGIGVVATNDAHYLTEHDGCAHDTLLCLGMGAWKTKPGRMRFAGAEHASWEFYVKNEQEMRACAPKDSRWQTAVSNTALVADMVEESVVPMGKLIMPRYEVPKDDVGFRVWKETGVFI